MSTTLTAYNASGTAFNTSLTRTATREGFIIKYNSSGVVQWIARLGSTNSVSQPLLVPMSDGSIAVTGTFSGTYVYAYNSNGTNTVSVGNSGSSGGDAFLVKYNSSGACQWGCRSGGSGDEQGNTVSVLNDDGFIIAGAFSSSSFYAADPYIQFATSLTSSGAYYSGFIVKYTSSAGSANSVAWVAKQQSTAGSCLNMASCALSDGGVVITGKFSGSGATFTMYHSTGAAFSTRTLTGSSTYQAYLVKYDSSGYVQWLANVGDNCTIYSVCSTNTGNIYVTGNFSGTNVTAYNSDGTAFATALTKSGTSSNGFTIKYNSSGFVQYIMRTVNDVLGNQGDGNSCICPTYDNTAIVVGGSFESAATLYDSAGSAFGTTLANPYGNTNGYIEMISS
jgi:hypothetical protein